MLEIAERIAETKGAIEFSNPLQILHVIANPLHVRGGFFRRLDILAGNIEPRHPVAALRKFAAMASIAARDIEDTRTRLALQRADEEINLRSRHFGWSTLVPKFVGDPV